MAEIEHLLFRSMTFEEGLTAFESQVCEHGLLLDPQEMEELGQPTRIRLRVNNADDSV